MGNIFTKFCRNPDHLDQSWIIYECASKVYRSVDSSWRCWRNVNAGNIGKRSSGDGQSAADDFCDRVGRAATVYSVEPNAPEDSPPRKTSTPQLSADVDESRAKAGDRGCGQIDQLAAFVVDSEPAASGGVHRDAEVDQPCVDEARSVGVAEGQVASAGSAAQSTADHGSRKSLPSSSVVVDDDGQNPGPTSDAAPDTHRKYERTIINDVIHGNIEPHPLLIKIIDTKHFQRLRNIKQLPGAYFVFPGAAHNRLEHSIGVAYLAGKVARRLQKTQQNFDITNKDILCVQIGGLCHNLGIGPFSHVFEKTFLAGDMKTEDVSVHVFEDMIVSNGLQVDFDHFGLDAADMTFIKEQIRGVVLTDEVATARLSRGQNKLFLYQIVGDRRSVFNVDAWDYFLRDSYHLQIKTAFDHKRLIKFIRVTTDPSDGKSLISIRDTEFHSLYNEFNTRLMHNRNAIQHKVSVAVELMIADALKKADNSIVLIGSGGARFKMSTAYQDVTAFLKLDDSVYHRILHYRDRRNNDAGMAAARQILRNIERRHLFLCVDEKKPLPGADIRPTALARNINEVMADDLHEDIAVAHVCSFDYGQPKSQNPVDRVNVYRKGKHNEAARLSVTEDSLLYRPTKCGEYVVRIYCKDRDDRSSIEKVRRSFQRVSLQLTMLRTPSTRSVSM